MHPLCVVPCLEEGVLRLTGVNHQPLWDPVCSNYLRSGSPRLTRPPLPRPTPGVSVNAQVACHQCSFRPRPAELAAGRSTLSLTPSSSGDSTRRGDTVAAARLLIWQVDGARAFGSVLASAGEGTGRAAALRRSHEAGGLWMFPMPSRPC